MMVQILNSKPLLPQLQTWIKDNAVPMCMFMPDRLTGDAHARNLAAFESLAKTLHDNQFVRLVPYI